MNKKLLALAAGAALLIIAQNSFALPGNLSAGNMSYDITIQDGCMAASTSGGVNFGTYASNSTDISGYDVG